MSNINSKILSGTKYAYLIAFFALVSGVFYPMMTPGETYENVIKGIAVLFLGLAGGIIVYKGATSEKKKTLLTTGGFSIITISLILIYEIANKSLFN